MAFQLATSGLYGAHRDEFYYLAGGHHLAWGYVDHPPIVPALYRLSEMLFGHSVQALHVLPAMLGGVYVILAVLLAREFGGDRRAQLLAAVVATLAPLFLTTSHFLSTVSLDVVAWAVASLLLARLIRNGDQRLWVAIGIVVGLGMMNKHAMAFWVAGAGIGLLVMPERRLLLSRWAVLGGAIAFLLFAPNLVWQARHGWATLEFLSNLRSNNSASDRSQFVPLQLLGMTLAGTVIWLVGLWALIRRKQWKRQRWLAVGYAALFVALFASGGKGYYVGSWYLPVIAVGAVVIERTWNKTAYWLLTSAVVVSGLIVAPLFTPILPEATAHSLHLDTTNKDLGGMMGWPHVVAEVATAFDSLPPDTRATATILTGNYSEAGAINFWRARYGLPEAISGHNTYWWWGYGQPQGGPVIAIGLPKSVLDRYWGDVQQITVLGSDGDIIDPQEQGNVIWLCREQKLPWAAIWPELRVYD
ncbi:MAG TPA: glycosyltransferase family 39 protein [Dehalococcoidia bacterium]|nr:glycosyltransferase family 39 protein [Dehalococcoidia bacterium]